MQGLGRQLSSLGASLAAEQEKADSFKFRADLQRLANEQEQKYTTYRDTVDGDAGNFPTDVLKGFDADWKKFEAGVPQSQKKYLPYYREHFRGQYQRRSYGDQGKIRARWYVNQGTNLFATTILPRINKDLGSVSSGLKAVDGLVGSMAGLPPQAQAKLREQAADAIFKTWLQKAGIDAEPQARAIIERYKATRIGPTPGSPRAAQEQGIKPLETPQNVPQGPLQFAPLPLKRTVGRPRTSKIAGMVFHYTEGSDTMEGNGSWSNKKGTGANYYIAKDGTLYQWAPDNVRMGHVGAGRGTVGPNGRHDARPDFANDNTIGVELMLRPGEKPTPQQIAAGVKLANTLAKKYGFTAKDIYGHQELAPGHRQVGEGMGVVDVIRRDGFGAAGPDGTMPAISVAKKGPLTSQDYFDELVIKNQDKIARISLAAAKIQAKAQAELAKQQHARDILAGAVPFNKYNKEDRDVLDSLFNTPAFRDAIGKGDPQAIQLLFQTGLKTNYMPKAAAETVQWLISQDDPKQAAMGHQIAAGLLARKPYLFDEVADGAKIKKHAETFSALKTLGYSDAETLQRMKEFDTPEWEAKKEQRAILAKTEAAKITAQDVANVWDESYWSGVSPNGFGNEVVALGQYKEIFRENVTRFGNVDIAKKVTALQMKRMWATTEVSGSKTLMRYPPEKFYKPVGNVKALKQWFGGATKSDHAWLTTDLQRTIRAATGEKVDPGNIAIAADAQTQREVMRGQPPSYTVLYKDKNGIIQSLFNKRWTPDQKGAEDAFAKAFADKRAAAEEQMKQKAETERRANKAKKEFGDQLKRLAPIKR